MKQTAPDSPEITNRIPPNRKRLWLFKGIAVLLPFLVLVLVEGLLRLFGYGHDLSLFVEDPQHKGYWVMNQHASERYFTETENATIGNFEPFLKQKAAGTLRIFVLGESTTIGYPYMHNGSFHRWLQYRLLHEFPDKDTEIINLALTAVNTYTVYGFAKELVDYQADAVLIYTGHNEYYGALGVGSTSSFAHNPSLMRLVIRLREFRLIQLINAAVSGIRKTLSGDNNDLRENLMKRMAADQQIAYESDVYQAGIDQFKTNLNDICQVLSQKKIPVLISNLVSNEKDLKPFISAPGNGATSAQARYELANRAYAAGNFAEAKKAYTQAKELDMLRFRAPEAVNQLIQDVATKYPGVTLVDTKHTFDEHSPHGILGQETLLEHVHPNLYGYALLSDAFYNALKKRQLLPAGREHELSFAELQQHMPITAVDSLKGAYEVMILKEGWPFNVPMPTEEKRTKTVEEELAGALVVKQITWPDAMNQLRDHYLKQNDTLNALKVTEAFLLEFPNDPAFYTQAAKLCLSRNDNEAAVTYLKKAFRLANSFETAQPLFITLLKLDRPEEAMPYLHYAAAHNQTQFSLNELQAFVQQLIAVKGQFEKDSTNVKLSNQLAAGYLKFANTTAANKYIEKSLQIDRKNPVALGLKEQIRAIKK
ncbi:GDSL-type esterase/lipase family protein [Spirosoma endophyticum]|uniref:GDSL-like Lipase/Acylhydrolase family protein n=1 Tax=Spirosoma endophyticum TaxID=662367 RepID=A0A1I1FN17_9BACT|nr:GDSL-type esterase/lipase family protein [Spirosoma endophyticum]SFC00929.1 GDSL-like Lipase/Acylhydrolase family protein [Spirosoma endophyticum]